MEHHQVVIIGAGPTGLMLACELALAGVPALVIEQRTAPSSASRAGGLSGVSLTMARYRNLIDPAGESPQPRFPWGDLHVDFSRLHPCPMQARMLPQAKLESRLEARASELGAEIRRAQKLVGLLQNDENVEIELASSTRITTPFLIGCDGARSRVRELAGIDFPGITYPEVNRLAQFTMPPEITRKANGDLEIPGYGTLPFGYTHNPRGTIAQGSANPDMLGLFTSEPQTTDHEPYAKMSLEEFQDSLRRVLGSDIPLGEPRRLTRFTFHARQAEYRKGRVFLAGDAAHLFPAPGMALCVGLMDSCNLGWKLAAHLQGRTDLLDTYASERRLAADRTMLHTQAQVALRRGHDPAAEALRRLLGELLEDEPPALRLAHCMAGSDVRYPTTDTHPLAGTLVADLPLEGTSMTELLQNGHPVLLDLNRRADLCAIAERWQPHVKIHSLTCPEAPAEALLVRPDAYIAWATDSGHSGLQQALHTWFG